MSKYIVTLSGKPRCVDAIPFQGLLLDPATGKPVIDEVALAKHPFADRARKALDKFSPVDVQQLIADSRELNDGLTRKEAGIKLRDGELIEAQVHTKEFLEARAIIKRDFHNLSQLIKNPVIREVAAREPKPGLVAYKLYSKDYNFTPQQVAELSTRDRFNFVMENNLCGLISPLLEAMDANQRSRIEGSSVGLLKKALNHGAYEVAELIYHRYKKSPNGHKDARDILKIAIECRSKEIYDLVRKEAGEKIVRWKKRIKRDFYGLTEEGSNFVPRDKDLRWKAKQYDSFLDFCAVYEDNPIPEYVPKFAAFLAEDAPESTEKTLVDFLEKRVEFKNFHNRQQPVHDALLDALLPADKVQWNKAAGGAQWNKVVSEAKWNTAAWRKHLWKQMEFPASDTNPDLLGLLRNANWIEERVARDQQDICKLSPENIYRVSRQLKYSNWEMDPAFAELCIQFGISQAGFDSGVMARQNIAREDHIPDIGRIEGKEIGFPGYYMVKLARSDPRILLVGQYAQCCNHVDGATAEMVLAHVTSPDSGCYAVFQEGKTPQEDRIVAKTSVWTGVEKDAKAHYDLCFNSWERKQNIGLEKAGESFLREAAVRVLAADPKTDRVTLGRNRDKYNAFTECDPVQPRDPKTKSEDSDTQYLIVSHRLRESGKKNRAEAAKANGTVPAARSRPHRSAMSTSSY